MKTTHSGMLLVCAVLLIGSDSFGERTVEVTVPFTPVYTLPSTSSDARGQVRQGQRFPLEGESGSWYRIVFYNTRVFIPKESTTVHEDPVTAADPMEEKPPPAVKQPEKPPVGTVPPKTAWRPPFSQGSEKVPTAKPREAILFLQVRANGTPVHTRPDSTAELLATTSKETVFASGATDVTGSWHQISLCDTIGWIHRSALEPVTVPAAGGPDYRPFLVLGLFLLCGAVWLLVMQIVHHRRSRRTAAAPSARSLADDTLRKLSAAALEGDIAGNLSEILQFIEIGRKTGCLLLETTGAPPGRIFFEDGRIVHAQAPDGKSGREAISALLALGQGSFRFLLDKQPRTQDLNVSITEVLLEWSRIQDEANRD